MTFNIDVDIINAQGRMLSIRKFAEAMKSPKLPLIASKRVAAVWSKSFNESGSEVGGWARLKNQTVTRRMQQGFGGEHPILKREGILEAVAITAFMRDRTPSAGNSAWTGSDSYHGTPVTASLWLSEGKAKMTVVGYKANNQWAIGGKYPHEARPFWFVNPNVEAAATKGVSIHVSSEARKA